MSLLQYILQVSYSHLQSLPGVSLCVSLLASYIWFCECQMGLLISQILKTGPTCLNFDLFTSTYHIPQVLFCSYTAHYMPLVWSLGDLQSQGDCHCPFIFCYVTYIPLVSCPSWLYSTMSQQWLHIFNKFSPGPPIPRYSISGILCGPVTCSSTQHPWYGNYGSYQVLWHQCANCPAQFHSNFNYSLPIKPGVC